MLAPHTAQKPLTAPSDRLGCRTRRRWARREEYESLCGAVEEGLRAEVASLRFARTQ